MDYNEIDPLEYENRHLLSARESYTYNHWLPIFRHAVDMYCRNGTIVDLGCGFGSSTKIIRQYNQDTIGIDIAYKWLIHAKKDNPNVELIYADCHNIPLKNNSIDTIVSWGLFEFIDRKITIKEMYRILKDKGICIVIVPNAWSAFRFPEKFYCRLTGKTYGKDEPSKSEMIVQFNEAGLEIIELKMDDGLIMLPHSIDQTIGLKIYQNIEWITQWFGENPFSNIMFLVGRKVGKGD